MLQIDRFVEECRSALSGATPEIAIRDIVRRSVSNPADLQQCFGTPTAGGITTLHRSPDLTVLHIVWAPAMTLYPHDHRMWAVIGLYGGREDNRFYRRTAEGIEPAGGRLLDACETVVLGKSIVHAVTNPLRQFTAAIHVYGGDFFGASRSQWDPVTLVEQAWDMDAARRAFDEANERWLAESSATARG